MMVSNEDKIRAIAAAAEGPGSVADKAAAATGISRRTIYDAMRGRAGAATQRKIDEAYARVSAGGQRQGATEAWAVGDVIGAADPDALDECVVACAGAVPFVARVAMRRAAGQRADKSHVLVFVPPQIAAIPGAGEMIETGREIGYAYMSGADRQHDRAAQTRQTILAGQARRRAGLTFAEAAEMDPEDLFSAARDIDERQMRAAELVAEQMTGAATELERSVADGDYRVRIAARRAGMLRERAAWINKIIAETRLQATPAAGAGWVEHHVRQHDHDRADKDPEVMAGQQHAPQTAERDKIAAAAYASMLDDLRDWGATAEEITELGDHLLTAESRIEDAAGISADEAAREARERAGVLKRRIARFVRDGAE